MLDLGGVGVILFGEYFYTFAPFGVGGAKKDSENSGEKYVCKPLHTHTHTLVFFKF